MEPRASRVIWFQKSAHFSGRRVFPSLPVEPKNLIKFFFSEYPGQKYLEQALKENMSDKEYEAALARAHKLGVEDGLNLVFDKYDLDAIVAPAWTQMSIYAAWSGEFLIR